MDWHYIRLHSNFRTSRSWQIQILAMSEMNLKQKITFVALFQVTLRIVPSSRHAAEAAE